MNASLLLETCWYLLEERVVLMACCSSSMITFAWRCIPLRLCKGMAISATSLLVGWSLCWLSHSECHLWNPSTTRVVLMACCSSSMITFAWRCMPLRLCKGMAILAISLLVGVCAGFRIVRCSSSMITFATCQASCYWDQYQGKRHLQQYDRGNESQVPKIHDSFPWLWRMQCIDLCYLFL